MNKNTEDGMEDVGVMSIGMEDQYQNDVAVQVPRVLLPKKGTDYSKWAVVACDQYTSQPEYWEEARRIVGKAPSTLELILPEAYLEKPGEEERIKSIKTHMREYLEKGVLVEKPQGFVLVTRTVGDITCTCPVESTAATAAEIVIETLAAEVSERGATRMDDKTSEASMEKRKKDGYF